MSERNLSALWFKLSSNNNQDLNLKKQTCLKADEIVHTQMLIYIFQHVQLGARIMAQWVT